MNQNTYDKLNRLVENIDKLNQKTSYSYDALGNLLSVVDPLGNKTENKYDTRNRLIETIDPDSGITKFTYDLSNNLTSVTDPVNNKTIFAYDARNRAIRETSPTGLVTVREYDATNNLTATDKFQIGSINTVNHSDFSNLSGLTLNGDTADVNQTPVVDNNQSVLRLINGSAFLSEPISLVKDNLDTSFSSAFQFRIPNAAGLEDSDGAGADGFTFVLATSPTVLGGSGGGLGYEGIANSLAVEFDTFDNGSPDQNSGNHLGINLNGDVTSVVLKPVDTRLNNGEVWYAWIDYNGEQNSLEVRLSQTANRPSKALLAYFIDIRSLLEQNNAYVGFSAGTAGGTENHDILSWKFDVSNSNSINRRIEFKYDDINRLNQEKWVGTDQIINYSYDKASNQTAVNDKFSSLAFNYDNRDRLLSVNNAGTPGFSNVVLNYSYD
ncbi:MAG: lectin-like domain-containing protein, partial [Dolichospermum sp.]